jgi:hypothetical protein
MSYAKIVLKILASDRLDRDGILLAQAHALASIADSLERMQLPQVVTMQLPECKRTPSTME